MTKHIIPALGFMVGLLTSLMVGLLTVDVPERGQEEVFGSQMTGSMWFLNAASQIQAGAATWGLRIPFLANCNTVDTDANGVFSCGAGGSSKWTDAGAYIYPTGGDYISFPYLVSTSTATSTLAGGVSIDGSTRLATSLNGFGYLVNGAVSATTSGTTLKLNYTASSTFSTIDDFFHLQSSGKISGGTVTDIGGGAISVTSGTALIKVGALSTNHVVFSDFAASSTVSIPTNSIRWIGVDYNSGVPKIVSLPSDTFSYNDSFPLAIVSNEAGSIYINNNPRNATDVGGQLIRRFHQTRPFERDELVGGIILAETGTRNLTLSAGYLWDRNNRFTIPAFNSAVSGTFDMYIGTTRISAGNTQWDNLSYNNGGTLASTTANRWGNLWFYVMSDGSLFGIYGTSNATSQASAETETQPTTLPYRCPENCKLISRLTFQKSASTGSFSSAFGTVFVSGAASNHSALSNLAWTASGHTGTAGKLAGFSSTGVANEIGTSTPSVTAPITYSGTLGYLVDGASGSFGCTSASAILTGCLTAADFNVFNNKLASTSIDTSSELAAIITDETGTGNVVFSATPNFTGTIQGSGLFLTGTSTLGNATATSMYSTTASSTSLFASLVNFGSSLLKIIGSTLTGLGIWDLGGADSLEIPNSASPTLDAAGEIAVDTTYGQFKYFDGAATHVITGTTTRAFNIASTTKDANGNSFNTATMTLLMSNPVEQTTLIGWYCKATTTGSVSVRFGDGTNWTNDARCSTGAFTPATTNNTFTQFEDMQVQIGSGATNPSRVTITTVTSKTAQ